MPAVLADADRNQDIKASRPPRWRAGRLRFCVRHSRAPSAASL